MKINLIDLKKIGVMVFLFGTLAMDAQNYPEVTIPNSEIRRVTSSIVSGQEYELQIHLPAGYDNGTKTYPVVYLMDSQWDFPLVASIYGEQYYDGFIPELIVVGVTWGGKNPNPDVLRARDYTPTNDGRPIETGGADKFLDVLKTEVFPFIESHYRVNGHRTLLGCSLGGLFTLYSLFTHNDMFTGYVAASPAIGWDNGIMERYEKEFAKKELQKPVRVFMTVGDVERGRPYFEKFANTMEHKNYGNVSLRPKVLENTGHSGTKSETYTRGLQYVFERNQLKLSDEVLNKFVGQYQFENGNKVEIKNENNGLKLYLSTENKVTLLADSETHFYATFEYFNVHFKEVNGVVEGFDWIGFNGTRTLKKLK